MPDAISKSFDHNQNSVYLYNCQPKAFHSIWDAKRVDCHLIVCRYEDFWEHRIAAEKMVEMPESEKTCGVYTNNKRGLHTKKYWW